VDGSGTPVTLTIETHRGSNSSPSGFEKNTQVKQISGVVLESRNVNPSGNNVDCDRVMRALNGRP
jgi:hypothetical protein